MNEIAFTAGILRSAAVGRGAKCARPVEITGGLLSILLRRLLRFERFHAEE